MVIPFVSSPTRRRTTTYAPGRTSAFGLSISTSLSMVRAVWSSAVDVRASVPR